MIDLERIRKEKNLTMSQVAEETGISLSFYCQIENKNRKPSVDVAKKIASVLDFDWTLLFA